MTAADYLCWRLASAAAQQKLTVDFTHLRGLAGKLANALPTLRGDARDLAVIAEQLLGVVLPLQDEVAAARYIVNVARAESALGMPAGWGAHDLRTWLAPETLASDEESDLDGKIAALRAAFRDAGQVDQFLEPIQPRAKVKA